MWGRGGIGEGGVCKMYAPASTYGDECGGVMQWGGGGEGKMMMMGKNRTSNR